MLVDAKQGPKNVRKSQAITDGKAYDARLNEAQVESKKGRISHIWHDCEILHRCATYVTVSKQETVYICVCYRVWNKMGIIVKGTMTQNLIVIQFTGMLAH